MKQLQNTLDREDRSEIASTKDDLRSALNSVSIHSMKSEIPMSAGSGAGRTPKFIKDFSYSLNKILSLLLISEIFSPKSLSDQPMPSQGLVFFVPCCSATWPDRHC
jgi:hypothetical protein